MRGGVGEKEEGKGRERSRRGREGGGSSEVGHVRIMAVLCVTVLAYTVIQSHTYNPLTIFLLCTSLQSSSEESVA